MDFKKNIVWIFRILQKGLFFTIVLFLIDLCTHTPDVRANPSDNILRFGYHVSQMGNFDPHLTTASQDRILADLVFNGLLRYVPGQADKIEPDLAIKMPTFHMEKGKQVCRIELKRGVMFHPSPGIPSHELTAEDVVYSLNKSADMKHSAYASNYAGMTVHKNGRYAIEITINPPLSTLLFFSKLTNYGGGFIVSKKAVTTMGFKEFAKHPVGTGPFAFKQYLPGNKVDLTAHKNYFRGTPKLKGIEFHLITDLQDREEAFRNGKMDIITGSGEKGWIKSIETLENIKIDTHGVGEVNTIFLNTRVKPMDDIRVRRAVAYALNRDDFLRKTSPLISGPVFSPVPELFMPGGLSQIDVCQLGLDYPQNLKKAKELLTQAGYPEGFCLDLVTSEKRLFQVNYQILKKQLAQVGINCRIKVVSHRDMHKSIRDLQHPQLIVIYVAWRPNADAYLSQFFHSHFIPSVWEKAGTNFAYYDKIDQLIDAARIEIHSEKQIHLWSQAQIRILNDMAALPIMYTLQMYVRKAWLDYGHPLESSMALYPQFTEKTCFVKE
ncbi:ABC transporter substrate-binding protein [Desulfocicer niacini]